MSCSSENSKPEVPLVAAEIPATWEPKWDPCSAIPTTVINELGLGAQPPQPEAPQHDAVATTCGFGSVEPQFSIIVTVYTQPLESRRIDERFTMVRESWLEDRAVAVSHFPNLSCHYAVDVEPGMVDFQVRYNLHGALIRTLDEACDQAQRIAEGFAPYLPERLDS